MTNQLYLLLLALLSPLRLAAKCVVASLPHPSLVTPFCQQSYHKPISIDSSTNHNKFDPNALLALDQAAQATYNRMLGVLAAFDCNRPYSYHTCDECRAHYKTWICLMTMPNCIEPVETTEVGGDGSTNSTGMKDYVPRKPCLKACNNVLRACPYNLKFSCPQENSLFPHDYSTDTAKCDAGPSNNNTRTK